MPVGLCLGSRSIPACAGEPDAAALSVYHSTVYPRVCGGTDCSITVRADSAGLSPRVRGNLSLYS